MKSREYEITTGTGPFTFLADNMELAHDHAMTLKNDDDFVRDHGAVLVSDNVWERVRHIGVRFIGWTDV